MQHLLIGLCSGLVRSARGGASEPPAAPFTSPCHLDGIEGRTPVELSHGPEVYPPDVCTTQDRAHRPIDPADCDDVRYRHDSWLTPEIQAAAAYVPPVH